jgi:hypothetical protein
MLHTFDIVVRVELDTDETPALDDYRAWSRIARDELTLSEVYDISRVTGQRH